MAVNTYRYDGPRKKGYKSSALRVVDSNGVLRDVPQGSTVSLDDAVAAELNTWVVMSLATDPVPNAPIADFQISYDDLIDASTGKIKSSLLPAGSGGDGGPSNVFIQQTQPTSPPVGSLWIPLNVDGTAKSIDQWEVYA